MEKKLIIENRYFAVSKDFQWVLSRISFYGEVEYHFMKDPKYFMPFTNKDEIDTFIQGLGYTIEYYIINSENLHIIDGQFLIDKTNHG